MQNTPTCWKCGYDLRGIPVSDRCPECGTPVWSYPSESSGTADATRSLVFGVVALCLFFACIGPLAGLVAIPAIVYGSRVKRCIYAGRASPDSLASAQAGLVCGWITVVLSGLALIAYAALIAWNLGPF